MSLINYTLGIFFIFFLLNYSELTSGKLKLFIDRLHPKVIYAIRCSLCFTFHVTLLLFLVKVVPFYYLYTAPVLNMFLDLTFKQLSK